MIENLYIIGNGFDLHHKVNSKYSDFHKWFIEHTNHADYHKDVIEKYFQCEDLWSSFEENLSKFDYEAFAKAIARGSRPSQMSQNDDESWNYAKADVESLLVLWWQDVKAQFYEWLKQLKKPDRGQKITLEKNNAYFLTFNYTLTLEELYQISSDNILHVHGITNGVEEEIYLGHNGDILPRTESRLDQYVDVYGNILPSAISNGDDEDEWAQWQAIEVGATEVCKWQKRVDEIISRNEKMWRSLDEVKSVFVYGFGFSSVDSPYLFKIKESVPQNARWQISYHLAAGKKKAAAAIAQLGIEKVDFVRLEELMCSR